MPKNFKIHNEKNTETCLITKLKLITNFDIRKSELKEQAGMFLMKKVKFWVS